jgi:hypothetical protein
MIAKIAALKGPHPSPYEIRVFNLYNPFPGISIAERGVCGHERDIHSFFL